MNSDIGICRNTIITEITCQKFEKAFYLGQCNWTLSPKGTMLTQHLPQMYPTHLPSVTSGHRVIKGWVSSAQKALPPYFSMRPAHWNKSLCNCTVCRSDTREVAGLRQDWLHLRLWTIGISLHKGSQQLQQMCKPYSPLRDANTVMLISLNAPLQHWCEHSTTSELGSNCLGLNDSKETSKEKLLHISL